MSREAYSEYLQTDEWKARRRAALERSADRTAVVRQPRCEVCGRSGTSYKNARSRLDPRERRFRVEGANGLQVHHLSYRDLGNETPADLIVLCTNAAAWAASGYRDLTSRGCHERAHDDPAFRREVERVAQERMS